MSAFETVSVMISFGLFAIALLDLADKRQKK